MSILDYGGDFAAGLMQGMRDYQAQQMQKQQWQNQLWQQTWDRNMSERELELRRRQLEQQAADADRRFTGDEADRRLREMQLQQQANPRLSLADLFKYVQGGAGIAPEFQKSYFDFGNRVAQQYNLPQFEGTQLQKAVDPNKRLDASVRLGLGVPRLQSVMGQENYNAAVPNFNQLGAMVNPEQPMTFNPQVGATPVEARNTETARANKQREDIQRKNAEIRQKQIEQDLAIKERKLALEGQRVSIAATRAQGAAAQRGAKDASVTSLMTQKRMLTKDTEAMRDQLINGIYTGMDKYTGKAQYRKLSKTQKQKLRASISENERILSWIDSQLKKHGISSPPSGGTRRISKFSPKTENELMAALNDVKPSRSEFVKKIKAAHPGFSTSELLKVYSAWESRKGR